LPVIKAFSADNSASSFFRYRAFGLNIESELECGSIMAATGEPDVYVCRGVVPQSLENATATGVFYQASPGRLLLNVPSVARFLISSGNKIVVDSAPDADPDFVLLLLLGSAFGALLHQRGILAFHGSAIVSHRSAVVFAGASGSGKSTLAAAFHQRGFPLLADDVCPVDTSREPVVLPGNPFLMLWADAVEQLGIDERHLRRARSGLEKYIFSLGDRFSAHPVQLSAVYLLELTNADHISLTPIQGVEKMKALCSALFRRQFVEGMGLANGNYLGHILDVARNTRVAVVKRPRGGFRVDELADILAADFAS
jgi:hypothetical protein